MDEAQYFYDEAGNLTKEQHYNSSGKRTRENIWTYNAAGQPLTLEEYSYPYDQQGNLMDPSIKEHLASTTRWSYDEQGRPLTCEITYAKGQHLNSRKTTYTYDDAKGIHTVLEEFDAKNSYNYETVITLGPDKQPVSSVRKYIRSGDPLDGKISAQATYAYVGNTVVKTTHAYNSRTDTMRLSEKQTETRNDQGTLVSIETVTYDYLSEGISDKVKSTRLETYNDQELLTELKISSDSGTEHFSYTYTAIQVPETSLRKSGLSDIQQVDY